MLSEAVTELLSQSFTHFVTVKILQFHWNPKTRHLTFEFRRNPIAIIQFVINILLEALFMVTVPVSVIHIATSKSISDGTAFLCTFLLCIIASSIIQWSFLPYQGHFVTFTNKFFQFEKLMSKYFTIANLNQEERERTQKWDLMLQSIIKCQNCISGVCVLCALIWVSFPNFECVNLGFYLFGKYHWSGYIYAPVVAWLTNKRLKVANIIIYIHLAYFITTVSNLKQLG